PKIYPITDRRLSGLSHAEQVNRLIDGGAKLIQLREKRLSPKQFYREAVEAIEIARIAGAKIIINDRVDIALVTKADGVHLGQDDLPPEQARKLLGREAIIGFSTHSAEQFIHASRLSVDYIAAGPVFATSTKDKPDPTIGLAELRVISEAFRDIPLVAIGGITAENAQSALDAGADSVAVVSHLISDPEQISLRMKELGQIASHNTVYNR
ncbi:MAG TPA: thiamine phosphate synthase, partial [Pyrinomonadaceae bacterium]|nr:thiamine phosphate synthase [Pyrinomonadaceae bacterium]